MWFPSVLQNLPYGKRVATRNLLETPMTAPRLLTERSIEPVSSRAARPVRSVTINLAESPLGWLFARGHVSRRQYDAGEKLRHDWERSQLAPRVTMSWDAAPVSRTRGGSSLQPDLNGAQLD